MKRALSLLLCLGLLAGGAFAQSPAPGSVTGRPLTDTGSNSPVPAWAVDAYDHLEGSYVLSSGSAVSGPIDRGSFLELLVNALRVVVPSQRLNSVDLEPYYYYFADNYLDYDKSMNMIRAAAYGITQGSLQGEYRYGSFQNTLTRQEAAKMVCSTLDFFTGQGYEVQAAGTPAAYADAAAIAPWAAPYTGRIAAYQLMEGDQNGNFGPTGELDWPSAVVLVSRTLERMEGTVSADRPGVALKSQMDWSAALRVPDSQMAKPLTGYALGYYAIDNGDGTLSGLTVAPTRTSYTSGAPEDVPSEALYYESYDAQGNVTDSKTIPMELPIFGGFLDGGDHFYVAFGQKNTEESDAKEVWRIVQYDRDWDRVAAASVTGGASHTTVPYKATVSRMALSGDGKTLALHAARERYTASDGKNHQSNVTITVSTDGMRVQSVSGEFPADHVSHSFGQFVQFDGGKTVTVDHGDAYPRSFILQEGSRKQTLLDLYGYTGDNVTHAIGSGFEVTDSGYLFLGCSARQDGSADNDTPWNVFLTYTGKSGSAGDSFTWLTQGDSDIRCARLVKLSGSELLAMWGVDGDVHYQRLDGKGKPVGEAGVLENAPMPTTQPVFSGGAVRWIGVSEPATSYGSAHAAIYELAL